MLFCAYCGKPFSRKEHLERHLPNHTNVKPFRCDFCQMSFARNDLLQRHIRSYHEVRDLIDPPAGGVPHIHGRTPIACQNCASAKTGCDKRVPCARCADKNLPCAARFARRSSKAAVRAAQASAAYNGMMQQAQQPPKMPPVNYIDPNTAIPPPDALPKPPTTPSTPMIPDSLRQQQQQQASPNNHRRESHEFTSPSGLDDFMYLGNDFVSNPEAGYQDLLTVWPEYSIDVDMGAPPMPIRTDMHMATFDLGDIGHHRSEPMTASSSALSSHTRGTSIMSTDQDNGSKNERDASTTTAATHPIVPELIASEAAWPLARCNPPIYSATCPRTAIIHLESLEQKSKEEGTWNSLEHYLDQVDWEASDLASVIPLTTRTRDRMLAIAQSFLHKALEIHRGGNQKLGNYPGSPGDFNFIVLPPPKILEYFLRSYVRNLTYYYTLVVAGRVDPNEMLINNQASTLLLLLMIAQGAAAVPMPEARSLAAGLTETCRISLFDIIEKDVELSADPIALRCALLFIILGAWSGDKWLMDIVMGQRGMYLAMLRHAGMLEAQPSMVPTFNSTADIELQWRTWIQREGQNRLVYNWVMVDQELSLFHDTAPMLSITDLRCPMPGPEVLWMATDSKQWYNKMLNIYGCTANVNPQLLTGPTATSSLFDLFQDLLNDNLSRRQQALTPQQLRLLLHPIQAMLYHLRQTLSCFADIMIPRRQGAGTPASPGLTKSTMLSRLDEVHILLDKWYELAAALHATNPGCTMMRCNLVLYHLICLNAFTNFPEIERLARREGFDPNPWELSMRYQRCITSRKDALMHCGQVIRLLRSITPDRRPTWWSAAVYRAIIVLWVDSIAHIDQTLLQAKSPMGHGPQQQPTPPHQKSPHQSPTQHHRRHDSVATTSTVCMAPTVALDQVIPGDPSLEMCFAGGEGLPMLTRTDGSTFTFDGKAADVLGYGIMVIDEGANTRIGDGIKRKFLVLGDNWGLGAARVATQM